MKDADVPSVLIRAKGMAERIETPSKSQLKRWRKLTLEKYRRQERRFLVEGVKIVSELLRSGWPLETLLVSKEKAGPSGALLAAVPREIGIYGLSNYEWAALSQDAAPEGIMAVAVMPQPPEPEFLSKAGGPLLLLYRVNNPNNLGALLRTADWFGFRTVVLSNGSVEATNPKAVRASMGSLFHLTVVEDVDFEQLLPRLRCRFQVVGSEVREGISPHPCAAGTALLMGSESHGLPASLLALTDERWRIPGRGEADSLSLPQAAAVMMYECTREIDKEK
jgi:TrmH family RNA methyltransferase